MMKEKWIKWNPINKLSNQYYVESISDNFSEDLKIILIDDDNPQNKVLITWANSVYAYRKTYETFTILTLNNLDAEYGTVFRNWSFFKIENSKYLKWLSEQSCGITDSLNLVHFCIYSTEEMFEVIANYEPNISLIENNV